MVSAKRDSVHGEATNGEQQMAEPKDRKDALLAEQKITFLACFQGGVASLGGFIFGYIRSVFPCTV